MSDSLITFIPQEPEFVPAVQAQQLGISLVKRLSPGAEAIRVECTDKLRLIDCGENFERIACPLCDRNIELSWWNEQVNQVMSRNSLVPTTLPCCGTAKSLHELTYEWPQGFARFSLEVMNPPNPDFAETHVGELERVLGCDLRVIYTHI
ncbi:MAG: hypothetical protein JNK23_18450 [Opitutaceae bacterium]|nr:hypothetical protein [Opitutaceae bacterium]